MIGGNAITALLQATGYSPEQLARAMVQPHFGVHPRPTATEIREWQGRDELPVAVSIALRFIAAEEKLVWERGRWMPAHTERLSGEDVRKIRERLGWTQSRLAREIGTKQPQVAAWESAAQKRLSGLASYALRAVEKVHAL